MTDITVIYNMFLSRITDYRILNMSREEAEDVMLDYYNSAKAVFYKCKNNLEIDEENLKIKSDLTDLEKRIIVTLMLVEHITPQLVSSEKLQQTLNDKDFKIYSQANQLREVRLLLERMERRANKLITQYTFLDIEKRGMEID